MIEKKLKHKSECRLLIKGYFKALKLASTPPANAFIPKEKLSFEQKNIL